MPLMTPLQKELGKISAEHRRFKVLRQLSYCWAGLIVAVLAVFFLHSEFGFNLPYAIPILALAGAVACLLVVFRTAGRPTLRDVARRVEADEPALNTLLLAAMEQKPDPKTGEFNFLQKRVMEEALEANRKSPWQQRFLERLFFVQCGHLLLFIGACVALATLGNSVPGHGFSKGGFAGLEVTPGNIEVEKGSSLAVMARFHGNAPADASLVYRTASNGEQKSGMTRSLSDPIFGASLTDVQEDVTYRVVQPGASSPEYHIHVFEYPELKRSDAELDYPKYTGLQTAKVEGTRRVTAVEGTKVNYTFYLNKAVQKALLRGKDGSIVQLTNDLSGKPIAMTAFPLRESKIYSLELTDLDGRTNKLPAEFIFVALKNERPKLKLKSPRGDQRVSGLEEVRFEGEAEDDFGLTHYGLAYTLAGGKTETLDLTESRKSAGLTKPHEPRNFSSLLPLEKYSAEPGELVSYYLWAEDLGPDGEPRRTAGDIYFAEVRPYEEIFRENNSASSSSQQQQQQQQNSPATKLLELQKQIITASWNIQRREEERNLSREFSNDTKVVQDSQENAIKQAGEMKEAGGDDKSRGIVEAAIRSMGSAAKNLAEASEKKKLESLGEALKHEQSAYQALLKLQTREYQVSRSRSRGGQQSAGQQRAQQQLDQLELNKEENRYETESEAKPLQNQEQRESVQVLSRLKELAQRQQDMSERLKELQAALNEAKTETEKEKLRRELKRLQEEQQQIVQDTDALRQRMAQPENQSRMSDARQELDKTREQSQQAAQELQKGNVSQALSSSSRAQQQLNQLSDQFRKSTSSQFSDQMREMREQARELDQKQEQIAEKLANSQDTRQRSLSDEGPKKELMEALAAQKAGLTNLLQNMRQVTEQSEAAEPLLSRQLYESLRKTSQANPEKALDLASQLMEKNFLPQAQQVQESARGSIHNLRQNVEQAANSILGDESESLRYAQRELEKLTERVQREMSSALRSSGTNRTGLTNEIAGGDLSGTNRLGNGLSRDGLGGTNIVANASRFSTNQSPGSVADNSTNRTALRQLAGNGRNGTSQAGENGARNQQGRDPEKAESGNESSTEGNSERGERASNGNEGNPNSPGAPGQRGQRNQRNQQNGSGDGQLASNQNARNEQNQQGEGSRGGNQARQNPGARNGRQNFYEQWSTREGLQDSGGGGGDDGPLVGSDYSRWSDGLRDIEEVLQNPKLRTDVARIRERARTMRLEFKRNSTLPQWKAVQSEIVTPLRILQTRVEEELAHINSREAVVPLDRDPVPAQYSELVNRYYEKLGKE